MTKLKERRSQPIADTTYRFNRCDLGKCDEPMLVCCCGCGTHFCAAHHPSMYWLIEDHMYRYWYTKEPDSNKQFFVVSTSGYDIHKEIQELLDD